MDMKSGKNKNKLIASNADILLLSIYRLIGIFPLLWRRSPSGEISGVASPRLGALGTLIVFICGGYNVSLFLYAASAPGIEYTLLFIKNLAFTATMLAITFCAWIHCSKYEIYLRILAEVDVQLQWRGPTKWQDRCIIVSGLVLLFVTVAFLFFSAPSSMNSTYAIRFVKEVYLISFAFLVMHLVYGLRARYRRLNSILSRVNPLQSGAEKIREICDAHSQLSEAAAVLRIAVAPAALALLLHAVLIVASAVDFVVRGFRTRPAWVLMSMSLNIVTAILRFLALFVPCDAVQSESKKTVKVVLGLYHNYCKKPLPYGLERNFVQALDQLWFQLIQHDMPFNMAGFFVMTVPHLGVMVNTITTYYLLLMSANSEGYSGF